LDAVQGTFGTIQGTIGTLLIVPKGHPSEGQLRPSTTLVRLDQNAAVSEYR
jgi:hypothetical protein